MKMKRREVVEYAPGGGGWVGDLEVIAEPSLQIESRIDMAEARNFSGFEF